MAEKIKEVRLDAPRTPRPGPDAESVLPWVKTIPAAEAMSWIHDLASDWEHGKSRLTVAK